jgi:hypothetical protein
VKGTLKRAWAGSECRPLFRLLSVNLSARARRNKIGASSKLGPGLSEVSMKTG